MFTRDPLRWFPALVLAGVVPVFAQAPPPSYPIPPLASTAAVPPMLADQQPPQVTFVPKAPAQITPEELGDSLEGRRQYQAAIESYKKVEHPTAGVWNKMGIAYQMMFNMKNATRCYRNALKLDRHDANIYNNLGTVYDSQKDYRKAERLYRKALKINPKSATVLKNLGTNLLIQHKYTKGWEAYTQALAIDPDIFMDHDSPRVENPSTVKERGALNYFMARGCVRMGQTECALQYLRMALNEGFITPKKLAEDQDFFILRANPGFKQLLAEQQQQKPPQNP